MTLQDQTIAFIGTGVMGEAMLKGLLNRQRITPDRIIATDPYLQRGEELMSRYGIRFTVHNDEAAQQADIVVLSVKPQVMSRVYPDIGGLLKPSAMVLSIAAGVKLSAIQKGCQIQNVVRAMPNTPGQIGEGMTVWAATEQVNEQQRYRAEMVLGALGETLYVNDEKFLDMATALNGSGPSYVFLLMEAMIDAGVHMGFSRQDSQKLVHQTMLGSVRYAIQSGSHPAELRNQVTSPGGTSAAALYQLEKGTVRTIISKAIWAAYNRSVELGAKDED
ncbi:MAG: pyrroline-5-carboxylate reductase [Anaerolineaceae bacterium]|nr:MAG: pyrroline-5-carboxylate reductase [Anaerolineaceae bacterium]